MRFGGSSDVDPSEEIGEALAVFADMESSSLRALAGLKPEQARDRWGYMKVVLIARQMRIELLQDLGFIDRNLGGMSFAINADAVRRTLREEGLLAEVRPPRPFLPRLTDGEGRVAERELVADDHGGDEMDRWLRPVEHGRNGDGPGRKGDGAG